VKPTFLLELPNRPTGDPAVLVRPRHRGFAILAEAGDLGAVPPRALLAVSVALVSHFHVDHAFGLARLLRGRLGHPERPLTIVGPAGSAARVAAHLSGYLWNLLPAWPLDLAVVEVHPDRVETWRFPRERGFDPRLAESASWSPGASLPLEPGPGITIRALPLDHAGTVSLAWRIEEEEGLHVDPAALDRAGLAPGSWLGELKDAVRRGAPPATPIPLPGGGTAPLAELEERFLFRSPGDTVAVAADVGPGEANLAALAAFVRGVRTLVCEAYYRQADRVLGIEHGHLSAGDAGRVAREGGVGRLVPFHLSPRYEGDEDALLAELASAADPVPLDLPGGTP